MDTRHAHDVNPYSTSPLRPLGLSYPPGPPPGSLSAGRAAVAEPAVPSYASSAAAPPPPRLLCPILSPPPTVIPCPTPRARAAALDRHAAPPREVGPAHFDRGLAPAPTVSLSSSARPYVPTLLAEAASAHLSLSPTADPKPSQCCARELTRKILSFAPHRKQTLPVSSPPSSTYF